MHTRTDKHFSSDTLDLVDLCCDILVDVIIALLNQKLPAGVVFIWMRGESTQFLIELRLSNTMTHQDNLAGDVINTFMLWTYNCGYIILGLGITVIFGLVSREDYRVNILAVTRNTNIIIPATHHHASGHGQVTRNESVTANSYL